MSDSTAKYVISAQNGDLDAFAKLYSRSLKSSYFLALKLCENEADAVEVAKNAYAQAFCTVVKLKKPEAFDIWIKHTVANAYKQRQSFVFNDADGSAPPQQPEFLPESVFEDESLSACVEQAVAALPAEQRAAIVLYYNNGMPVAALARYLGVSETTAGALLSKAKAAVFAASGSPSGELAAQSLPVLTRIFRRSAADVVIDNSIVRDVFIYASGEYEKTLQKHEDSAPEEPQPVAEAPVAEPEKPAEEPVAPPAEEIIEAAAAAEPSEEDKPAEDESVDISSFSAPEPVADAADALDEKPESLLPELPLPEAPEQEAEKAESFFNREPATVADALIGSIVGDSSATLGNDALEQVKNSIPITDNAVDEPQGISFADYQGISSLATAPEEDEASPARGKSSSVKTIVVSAVAVIIVAAVILVVYMVANKGKGDDQLTTTQPTTTAADTAPEPEAKYQWVPGGFEKYSELQYFNEYSLVFKDNESGKYGLMNYEGEVILAANYYNFQRCSSGKTYSNQDNYHYLLTLDSDTNADKYRITYNEDGSVNVDTDSPHEAHAVTDEVLENQLYDERDREHAGFFAARKNGKWGYINVSTGELAVPYEYEAVNTDIGNAGDYCLAVNGDYVAVKKGGLMGVINVYSNEILVPFEYNMIFQGDNGVFVAHKGTEWGMLKVGTAMTPAAEETTTGNSAASAEEFTGSFTVLEGGANIRADAGGDYDLLGEYEAGTMIEAKYKKEAENGKEWVGFEYNGGYGWISMSLLEETGA